MKNTARLIATNVIRDVVNGKSLTDSLTQYLPLLSDARDKAFAQSLSYNTCRMYTRLDILLSYLLKKPLPEKEVDVYALLLIGLCQLHVMQMPLHAAVSETVEVAKQLNKNWAPGLVNAILRNYLRQQESLQEKLQQDPEAKYSHPKWMITKIKKAWASQWHQILKDNNQQAPMALRVNRQKISRDEYLKLLKEHEIGAEIIAETDAGILLTKPMNVQDLPNFAEGFCSVQDGAAQLVAPLLDLKPKQLVLDACAAPGGKLAAMWELEPLAHYVVIEKDADRSKLITENLTRLQAKADVIVAEAEDTNSWWKGNLYDRILVDAPCSASGVIRRHPDIKMLREPTDLKNFSALQLKLLNALWPLLQNKGLLLYVTCSIFPEENEAVIDKFVKTHADVNVKKDFLKTGIQQSFGMQILPGMNNMDGFYYALLEKL